jgi:hypothetical protein
MRPNIKSTLLFTAAGMLSAIALFGILLAFGRLFPGSDQWMHMGGATVSLFGVVAYHLADDLKRLRPLLVFLALFLFHCVGFGYLVHSGIRIDSIVWLLIIFGEAAALNWIMWYAGGARSE